MPKNVRLFETLAYLSLGMGLIIGTLDYPRLVVGSSPATIVLGTAFGLVLLGLFIWLVARRRKNWARWTFLVLFLLGLPFSYFNLLEMLQASPIAALLSAVQAAIQAVALFFVFSGDANTWFGKPARSP